MKKFYLAVCLALLANSLAAQSTAVSQISGVVTDGTGAAVPGAQVAITNTDTSASRSVETGADGSYTLTALAVGPYRLQVTKSGFSTYNQTGIVLQVNTNPLINVSLKVGAVSEQVEVSANAALVETSNNTVGQVIDRQRVVELPLNGRNVAQLIALSGAAVPSSPGGIVNNLNYPTVSAFAVAGGQGNATNFFLDGGIHLDPRTNVGLPLPFPDALQEFRLETSTLPANYGSQPGGAVNVVTRSGTNQIHGNLFYFVRNGAMNARNVFAATRDSLKRNQFGGTVGGPVIKDKLFVFGGYQGTIERTAAATNVAFVPTPAALQGNFQTLLGTTCQARAVTLTSATGAVNNIVPLSRLNPVALKFLSLIPASTDPCGRVTYGVPSRTKEYQGVTRADWQQSAKNSVFLRYFVTDYGLDAYYDKVSLLTAAAPGLTNRVQSLILGDTYLISPRVVNSLRVSFNRSAVQRVGADGVPNMQQLGSRVTAPIQNYTGQIQINGYFNTGAIPGYVFNNTYTISDDVSMTMGAHQIAVGVNIMQTQMNALGPFQMNPRMTFNGTLAGNALGGFMTGLMDTMLQGNGQVGRDVQWMPAVYAQDNWKVSRRLQVNAGLRWDPYIAQYSKYKLASQFDITRFQAGERSQTFKNGPPGVIYPGDSGFPGRSDTTSHLGNWAPRIGMIFDPRGRGQETIRAAYGLFYGSTYMWNTLQVPLNPPTGSTITLNAPVGGLSDPWQGYPGGNPFPTPAQFPSDYAFPVGGTYKFQPLNSHPTYVQQWNVALQKQVGADWFVSATYLGNKTTHQWLGSQVNPAQYIAGGPCTLLGVTYNPCSSTASTNARRILTLARPTTGGTLLGDTLVTDDGGNASYNGLLLVLQHRLSNNFSVLTNYTWSHCLNQGENNQDIASYYQNPQNRRAEWGNCASDRRHAFNTSLVVQSPKFSNKMVQAIAGNWKESSIFSAAAGAWLNVTSGTDRSLTAVNLDRPNVVGDWHVSQNTLGRFFDTTAFAGNAAGQYGNAGRNVIRGRANWNLDISISRTFSITEKIKSDVRFEAFNMLNHARFNNPGTTLSNGTTFGVTTTALDPRILQVAMKLAF